MSDPAKPSARNPRAIAFLSLAVILIIGAAVVFVLYGHAVRLGWADPVAIGCSTVFLLAALRLGLDTLNPTALGRRMQVEGDSTPREVHQARLQAGVMLLMAVALALPVLADGFGLGPAWLIYAILAVAVGLRTLYSWRVMRDADEFVRARIHKIGWQALAVVQIGLLLYAGAERLGLAPTASAWDVLVAVMFVSLTVTDLAGRAARLTGAAQVQR